MTSSAGVYASRSRGPLLRLRTLGIDVARAREEHGPRADGARGAPLAADPLPPLRRRSPRDSRLRPRRAAHGAFRPRVLLARPPVREGAAPPRLQRRVLAREARGEPAPRSPRAH